MVVHNLQVILGVALLLFFCGSMQDCVCPDELPFPDLKMGKRNDQVFCGRELNMFSNSSDCERDSMYSCVVNTTDPVHLWSCPDQSDHMTPYCAPHSVKNCYSEFSKSLRYGCMRIRSCHTKREVDALYIRAYGKEFNQIYYYQSINT